MNRQHSWQHIKMHSNQKWNTSAKGKDHGKARIETYAFLNGLSLCKSLFLPQSCLKEQSPVLSWWTELTYSFSQGILLTGKCVWSEAFWHRLCQHEARGSHPVAHTLLPQSHLPQIDTGDTRAWGKGLGLPAFSSMVFPASTFTVRKFYTEDERL